MPEKTVWWFPFGDPMNWLALVVMRQRDVDTNPSLTGMFEGWIPEVVSCGIVVAMRNIPVSILGSWEH